MENNNSHDDLLIEYLVSDMAAEEKEIVENWINASEENRRYFESLKNAWQLSGQEEALGYILEEMNVDDKWRIIEQAIAEKDLRIASSNDQIIGEGENYDQGSRRKSGIYRFFVRATVAATVLLVLGLAWQFVINNTNKVEVPVAKNIAKNSDSLVIVMRHEVNRTGKEKRIQLPEGSLIVLADKSEISFQQPFTNTRDITLKGKAYFKIAKDQTRPFTVISEDILTTALGTEFTVTAFEKTNQIIVRLYEGKVMVKPVGKKVGKLKNEVYLLPGQEFIYSNGITEKPKSFKIDDKNSPEKILNQELERDNPFIPQSTQDAWYMFNNQSLEQVLDELSAMYNVKIIYNKEEIHKIYFTRKYNRSDSLEFILQEIGTLNNLKITKRDNAFIISK